MPEINDGGPAFPVWELNGDSQPELMCHGISMRDYFAAKALDALIAEPPWNPGSGNTALLRLLVDYSSFKAHEDAYATASYMLADAMLKARQS